MKTFVKGLRRPGGKTVEVDLSKISGDRKEDGFLFTETPGAGVYTQTLALPAGSTVWEVLGIALGAVEDGNIGWAADATFQVSDGAQDYFNSDGFDLHGMYNVFDPLTVNDDSGGTSWFGLQDGTSDVQPAAPQSYGVGLYYAAPTTLTLAATATTEETVVGGITLVRVIWSPPKTPIAAVKA